MEENRKEMSERLAAQDGKIDALSLLREAVLKQCTDVFFVAGNEITVRINGSMQALDGFWEPGDPSGFHRPGEQKSGGNGNQILMPQDTEELIRQIYHLAGDRNMNRLLETGDDDFSFAVNGLSRFRMNAYRQRGSLAAVIRVIAFEIPDAKKLHIPDSILHLGDKKNGLVLVTGPAGSGKSTTLACIIDSINHTRAANIITLEDPIEYLHHHVKALISQREIYNDTEDYVTGLRSTLRQSPDVILLGEMRDYQTISAAMRAAETGHLLLSTLHTIGAANTINRIIDVFPADQQHQVAVLLSMTLSAVVSQQLVPTVDHGVVPAFEIMQVTPAIRNLIRNGKVYQIDSVIASEKDTMVTMDASLLSLYHEGTITKETVKKFALNPETLERRM